MAKRITTPLDEETVARLKAGDQVLLSGVVYTARDAAHKRLIALIEEGKELPIDLQGQVIYYVGPAPAKPGNPIGSAGPTTSGRMDPYAPTLMEHGMKGMIGKGMRSKDVRDAMIQHRAVYFAAVGGAGALAAKRIKSAEVVAYEDLGPEAIRKLYVEDLPLFVINDIYGDDLYEQGVAKYRKD
ncbi:MAG: Fe-S-containing hydro-lyase [Clostridia bacterium]|nr:Fe-S-containing hydro-lyase [Clostridia bacterium]